MKPVIRYQSKLLLRRSYKPDRSLRIQPASIKILVRPGRFGIKPTFTSYECKSH